MKEFVQTDSQGFYVGQTVNYTWNGAIDAIKPKFDKETEKAKWDNENNFWIIKTIEEWEKIEKEYLESLKPSQSEIRKSEIITELSNIDIQSIRPNRAINLGLGTEFDKKKLQELEDKAKSLRLEYSLL